MKRECPRPFYYLKLYDKERRRKCEMKKGVHQVYILLLLLYNIYNEYM